jgi:hypothetical protein
MRLCDVHLNVQSYSLNGSKHNIILLNFTMENSQSKLVYGKGILYIHTAFT